MNVQALISQMTLEEKASFCSGNDRWHTEALERLGIPSIMMTDGPHGLRKKTRGPNGEEDYGTVESTCFPTAAGLACSWNTELVCNEGRALADEAKAEQVSILLGPGINMKRSPLCGRNFEYFSEDPYLAGKLAAAYIKGVQGKGVGTSLKHFAMNNQETRRFTTNANVDERTLREIYLTAFEIAIKESNPTTIMHSYNRINGTHVSDSKWLLNDILREEWGYDGFVMSDWNAMNDRVTSLEAGCELEMPSSSGMRDKLIVEAVRNGQLDEKILDRAVERILNFVFKYLPEENPEKADLEKNYKFAVKVAEESMVLLKNERSILPLEADKPLAVIGTFALRPRFQGAGSSHVEPPFYEDVYSCIVKRNGDKTEYSEGYYLEDYAKNAGLVMRQHSYADIIDEEKIAQAVETAKKCGRAVIFAGMPDAFESEGYDRQHMRMPEVHNLLIKRVAEAVPDTVVVLMGGSPVEMPWVDSVPALLFAYLGGSGVGQAITNLLFGDTSPSGKLAETYPVKLEDTPSYLNFPGDINECNYAEGIYIGYRYYQKKNIKVNFPFGYGLSYTTFRYDNIEVKGDKVYVTLTNTGNRAGKEVVELYVGADAPTVSRPVKELKGFVKVELQPGETKTVEFTLDDRSFAYYDVNIKKWHVEGGTYTVYAGSSVEDTPLTAKIEKKDSEKCYTPISRNTTLVDLLENEVYAPVAEELLRKVLPENMIKEMDEYGCSLKCPIISRRRFYALRMFVVWKKGTMSESELQQYIDEANRRVRPAAQLQMK